jgi:hypothetical protein
MIPTRILAIVVAAAFSLASVSPVLAQATTPGQPAPQMSANQPPSEQTKPTEPTMDKDKKPMMKKKTTKKTAPKKSPEIKEPASTEQGSGTTKQ